MVHLKNRFWYRCPEGCCSFTSDYYLDVFSRDCDVCGAVCEEHPQSGAFLPEFRSYGTQKSQQNLTKTLIYVAGPYRGNVEANVRNAELNAAKLALGGLSFICPHSNGHPHDALGLSDQYWIDMTLEIMRRCDAVFVVGNWRDSEGTLGEIKEAYKLGKPVFFDTGLLFDWARERCH